MRKLTQASQGLLGDLIESAKSLVGAAEDEAQRPDRRADPPGAGPPPDPAGAGQDLLGRGDAVLADLLPAARDGDDGTGGAHARRLPLPEDIAGKIAIAAYNFTRLQEDADALLNVANNVDAVRALLPF